MDVHISDGTRQKPRLYIGCFTPLRQGILFISSLFVPRTKQLHIKAIGVVTGTEKRRSDSLGTGIPVQWKQNFTPITISVTPQIFKNNVFSNTLFEELNEEIIRKIVGELMEQS